MKNKIPCCKITNPVLKKTLATLTKENGYPIDERYWDYDSNSAIFFVPNDEVNRGAGFAFTNLTSYNNSSGDTAFKTVSIEEMFDIMSKPYEAPFQPIEVKLNDEYTAKVQRDGSVKVGCQTFPMQSIVSLYTAVQLVVSKNNI